MNLRFTLLLACFAMAGAMAVLWWRDGAMPPPAVAPASSAPLPAETLPPPQDYVLAISWHAAFCETKPNLPECRDQRETDYTASHFALHGLWPQDDQYCGVSQRVVSLDESGRWRDLPAVEIGATTGRDLARVMPGTRDQLDRHQWIKHGTCSGVSAERYFQRSIILTEAINRSGVRDLFADNIGQRLTLNRIRRAFDEAFGAGAGAKVRLDCVADGRRSLAYELRISLDGDVLGSGTIDELARAGRNARGGCDAGLVDPVGNQ